MLKRSETISASKLLEWWVIGALYLVLGGCIAAALSGCTVTPGKLKDNSASFDGGQQNSGFLGLVMYRGQEYGSLTTNALSRYNDLLKTYGARLPQKVEDGDGVLTIESVDGVKTILIDNQHLRYFETMNRWRKRDAVK